MWRGVEAGKQVAHDCKWGSRNQQMKRSKVIERNLSTTFLWQSLLFFCQALWPVIAFAMNTGIAQIKLVVALGNLHGAAPGTLKHVDRLFIQPPLTTWLICSPPENGVQINSPSIASKLGILLLRSHGSNHGCFLLFFQQNFVCVFLVWFYVYLLLDFDWPQSSDLQVNTSKKTIQQKTIQKKGSQILGPTEDHLFVFHYKLYKLRSKIKNSSRIIFTNGLWDPWRSGGVSGGLSQPASDPDIDVESNRPRLTSLSKTLVSFKIPEAGHMYDLAASHPKDLPAVRMVRPYNKPLKLIICWYKIQLKVHWTMSWSKKKVTGS